MKKRIKSFCKRISVLVFLVLLQMNTYATSIDEGTIKTNVGDVLNMILTFLGLIPAVYAIIDLYNAFVSWRTAKAEGGSAQAAGKLSDNLTMGIIMAAIAAVWFAKIKSSLLNMLGY